MQSRTLFPVVAIALIGVLASCEDSTSIDENFEDDATWVATLTNESPSTITTNGTGQAWFIDRGNTIDYMISYSGLTSNTTNAHLHTTSNGNVYIQLPFVRQPSGVVFGTIDVSAGVVDVAPTPGPAGNQTVAELRTLLANGGLYVNVHTQNNGGGEIRGTVMPR